MNYLTEILFYTIFGILIIYDIIIAVKQAKGKTKIKTISQVFKKLGHSNFTVPLVCGVLMGHFFIDRGNDPISWLFHLKYIQPITLAILGFGSIIYNLVMKYSTIKKSRKFYEYMLKYSYVPLAIGIAIGYIVWSF